MQHVNLGRRQYTREADQATQTCQRTSEAHFANLRSPNNFDASVFKGPNERSIASCQEQRGYSFAIEQVNQSEKRLRRSGIEVLASIVVKDAQRRRITSLPKECGLGS